MLDVLVYLFENYIHEEVDENTDEEALRVTLREAGFPDAKVDKAFDWLETLSAMHENWENLEPPASFRLYVPAELERLDAAARGLLLFLEQSGVLDPVSRELVIDRLMALDVDKIEVDQIKWVVLLVLSGRPGHEDAFDWMEVFVYDGSPGRLH
jgi:Smg protein